MDNNSTQLIGKRADIYKLLSLAFYQPDKNILEIVDNLKELIAELYPSDVYLLANMEKDLQKTEEDSNYLLIDYARLFVGPFDVLAVPYGSVYLDNERRVMGDSTIAACQHYADAGLEIQASFKDVPDHIAVELEFMYYLNFRYLITGDEQYLKKQEEFLNCHLGAWLDDFVRAVRKYANTDFYRSLALLTQLFINEDKKTLQQVILEPAVLIEK